MKKICNYCESEYDGWQSEHSKCIDRYVENYPLFVEVPDDTFEKWEQLAVKKCPSCKNGMSSPSNKWICYHKDCPLKPTCYEESRPEKRHDYHWNNKKQEWTCTTIDCEECRLAKPNQPSVNGDVN